MSIVITTPTGNIGRRTLEQVLNTGAEVSVIVRHPEKLPAPIRHRVKIHQGALTDADLVTKAFHGATAVLWVTPADFTHPDIIAYSTELGEIAARAIKKTSVPYVVNISSAGAQLENAGPITGLGKVERLLDEVAENIIHLRPGFFMENFFSAVEAIQQDGTIYFPVPSNQPLPMIATQDIGDVAAELLRKTGWRGRSIRGLHGPADLTFADAANILSDSLGKPVKHVQPAPEQAYEAFLGIGASPGFAKAYVEMYQALAQPGAVAEARAPQTTTPTRLQNWSDASFRPLFAR